MLDLQPVFTRQHTSTQLVGAVVASSLLLAILGCATMGGSSQPASSPTFAQFQAEFMDAAIARREAGDPEGALELWAKGLNKAYFEDKVKSKDHPSHAEFAAALSEEWGNLQPLMDAKLDALLKEGKPYDALRLAMRAQYTNGLPNGEPPKAMFAAFEPEVVRWHMKAMEQLKQRRSTNLEASAAASAGHHALASCLYAGRNDKARRDEQIALRDRPATTQVISLLVDGGRDEVMRTFMPELQKRYEVVARANEQLVISFKDVQSREIKPRAYQGLSKEVLGLKRSSLLAYLDAHEALKPYYPRCASGDLWSCLGNYNRHFCETTNNTDCQVKHQPQLVKDYYFWTKSLKEDLERQGASDSIWSSSGVAYMTPARHHVVGDVRMTFSRDGQELRKETLRVGEIREGGEATAERAFGVELAKRAFVLIPEAFGHTKTLEAWDAQPGFSAAQADAYVRDFVTRLTKNQEPKAVEYEFVTKLCSFRDGYHSPTSFYTTLNIPM